MSCPIIDTEFEPSDLINCNNSSHILYGVYSLRHCGLSESLKPFRSSATTRKNRDNSLIWKMGKTLKVKRFFFQSFSLDLNTINRYLIAPSKPTVGKAMQQQNQWITSIARFNVMQFRSLQLDVWLQPDAIVDKTRRRFVMEISIEIGGRGGTLLLVFGWLLNGMPKELKWPFQ